MQKQELPMNGNIQKKRPKPTAKKLRKQNSRSQTFKNEPWKEEAMYGARVYKLSGYTTIDKIERKFASEQKQMLLRKILTILILFMVLLVVIAKIFGKINTDDFKKLSFVHSISQNSYELS